jgi:ribosome maturation factor RimP
MYNDTIIAALRELIEGYLQGQGLVLVDLVLRREGRNLVLRVLADRPEGGIDIDTCTRLNSELGLILDEKKIFQEGYLLEVSSPGLDRPLKTRGDFLRCLKREAVFFLSQPVRDRMEWQGVIKAVREETVLIERSGEEIEIPLGVINKAKQLIKNI